jgi:Holliday junction DNA helicase RuvA
LIAQLSGTLVSKQPNSIVIDVKGVGYEVTIPLSTFYVLSDVSSEVSLRIHTHVREDVLQLFGFQTSKEKELFLKLTGVSGVGPKLAIAMLSMPVSELVPAITNNDLARLTTIPGVGRKTAERVVVELRDKVAGIAFVDSVVDQATAGRTVERSDIRDDTVAALVQLGYPKQVAERTVLAAMREEGEQSIEALLKRSLKQLSR